VMNGSFTGTDCIFGVDTIFETGLRYAYLLIPSRPFSWSSCSSEVFVL